MVKRILSLFSVACVLGLLTTAIAIVPVSAAPSLTLSAARVLPGGTVTIEGSGLTGFDRVNITIGWGANEVVPLTSGAFSKEFTVPPNLPVGETYTVSVVWAEGNGVVHSNTEYGIPLTITIASIAINLSSTNGYVGDIIGISGGGFAPNQQITLLWDGVTSKTIQAEADGIVSANFEIPRAAYGDHTISVSGNTSLSNTFTVNPKITVTPNLGGMGDTVIVTGTGFPKDATVTMAIDSNAVGVYAYPPTTPPSNPKTTGDGSFSASFVVPLVTSGEHTVTATSGGRAATDKFTVGPKISVTPSAGGKIGSTIEISGSGFPSGRSITFTIDGAPLTVSTPVITGLGGVFSAAFVVPTITGGSHSIVATDGFGSVAVANFTVIPQLLSVSPLTGTVGATVTITGNGFTSGGTVAVSWDGTSQSATSTNVAPDGTISVTLVVPVSANGRHTIDVRDSSSNNSASEYVYVEPKIALSVSRGSYQDLVTVTFTGFSANNTISSIQMTNGAVTHDLFQDQTAGSNGSFTTTFTVPAVYGGTWTIHARDAASMALVQTTFTVEAKLVVSKIEDSKGEKIVGQKGDAVTFAGYGFNANSRIVFTCNGIPVPTIPATINTDKDGTFFGGFIVPEMPAGTVKLAAGYGSVVVADADITVESMIVTSDTLTPTRPGYVGLSMVIEGYGFKRNTTITVVLNNEIIGTGYADDNGSFSILFKIPPAPAGSHVISVSDNSGTTHSVNFFMDATPPGSATLASPAANAKPKQPVTFQWSQVVDPSGVTYTLQISQDPSFASIVIEKAGLLTNIYRMESIDKLQNSSSDAPYYWRVMATDNAGNEGLWSLARPFSIGSSSPSWVVPVLCGIGAVLIIAVVLFLGLWLGRRRAYQYY